MSSSKVSALTRLWRSRDLGSAVTDTEWHGGLIVIAIGSYDD